MNKLLILGVALLVICASMLFLNNNTNEPSAYELRELDRINRALGVDPSDLANPRSRSVSQQARDLVVKEKIGELKK